MLRLREHSDCASQYGSSTAVPAAMSSLSEDGSKKPENRQEID